MKFSFVRLTCDSIDVSFDKIYSQQNKELRGELILSNVNYLIDDLSENIVYYLGKLGINDLLVDYENEDVFNEVCKEYEKWLKDNFNISDFE